MIDETQETMDGDRTEEYPAAKVSLRARAEAQGQVAPEACSTPDPGEDATRMAQYVEKTLSALDASCVEIRLQCLTLARDPHIAHDTVMKRAQAYADFVLGDTV